MKSTRITVLVVVTAALLLPVIAAVAQGGRRINQDFNQQPLKDVLEVLKRIGNLGDFTIPEGYGDKLVTVSIVDKTPSEAFTQVLDAVGLASASDAGALVIRQKASNTGSRQASPVATPVGSIVGREPPRPMRTDTGAGDVSKPATAALGAAGAAQKKDKIYRTIITNYMDLYMFADIFGATVIDENNYAGMSSGGSSGSSGSNGSSRSSSSSSSSNNRSSSSSSNNRSSSSSNRGY